MSDPHSLEQLDQEWDKLADRLAEVCPDMKPEINAVRAEATRRKREREEAVQKAHGDNGHWPPSVECPVCAKLLQRVENLARERCANPDDDAELQTKFDEVFDELYCKKQEETQ